MATTTISFSGIDRSWGILDTRPTSNTYNPILGDVQIPLFSTINSITPSYSHSATKTPGDTLIYARSIWYYSNAELGTDRTSKSMPSGTAITDSTVLGNGTLHAGNNVSDIYFRAQVSDTSSTWNGKLKTHKVSSCSLTIDYTPLDYTITLATRKGDNGTDDNFQPSHKNHLITGVDNKDGTATITINTSQEQYTNYVFDHWEDGSTNPTRTIPLTSDGHYVAIYKPGKYTVNYYDITSGEEVLLFSQDYEVESSYDTISLPVYNGVIPEGHGVNPVGWVQNKTGSIRNGTTNMYIEGNLTELMTQYTNFTNLGTIGEIKNLYFGLYPMQYAINYTKYTQGTMTGTTTTSYRLYGDGDYTLTNLPSNTTGYKLTNKMSAAGAPADDTITNSWFVSNEAMNPGDPMITTVSSTLADNITVYSYETPNEYTINYYNFTSGEDVLITSIIYQYETSQAAPTLPTYETIPEGYGINPIGWVNSKEGSIRNGTSTMYSGTSTSTVLAQITTISNLSSTDGDVFNYYFGLYPIQYLVNYKKYTTNSTSNYTPDTGYRIYDNGDYTLIDLPSATGGYKLTNKMLVEGGPIDTTITNSWFTSDTDWTPGAEKITTIPSTTTTDVTVYSFETPIDFTVNFHTYDYNGDEINLEIIPCKYNITQTAPAQPETLNGQVVYGWYSTEQDISTWYIQVNTNTLINGTTSVGIAFGSNNISTITTQDQTELHYYGYYIPRQYSLIYKWLDNWSPNSTEYILPAATTRIYGRDSLIVELIPNYEDYIIDNANTINWYYYENDDQTTEQLTNNWDVIPNDEFENKVFYALKTPKDRIITFSSNDNTLGTITVTNQTDNNIYQEEDLIYCYVAPTEIGYFSHWSDGSTLPIRTITVGSKNVDYMAYFNNDKCLGLLDAYVGILPIRSIFLGTLMKYKEIELPVPPIYDISNISTTYKFTLNESTGYYVSENKGINNSYSLCQVNINIINDNNYIMYVDCINSGENNFDFGILSNLNQSLVNSYTADTSTTLVKKSFKGLSSTSVQTVSYDLSTLDIGNHFIQIKYRKDGSSHTGNDSLQFKIRFEKKEEN